MELAVTPLYELDKVTFNYTIRNTSDTTMYVPQFMPWRSGPIRGCYVYVHSDGQLLLYFGTVPNPPLVCFAQEVRLYAERLMPGMILRPFVTLSVPVLEHGKVHQEDAKAPHEQVLVSRLKMVVNYYRSERGLKVEEIPGFGLFDVWGTKPASLVAELVLPKPLVAQRRTDNFDRPFER